MTTSPDNLIEPAEGDVVFPVPPEERCVCGHVRAVHGGGAGTAACGAVDDAYGDPCCRCPAFRGQTSLGRPAAVRIAELSVDRDRYRQELIEAREQRDSALDRVRELEEAIGLAGEAMPLARAVATCRAAGLHVLDEEDHHALRTDAVERRSARAALRALGREQDALESQLALAMTWGRELAEVLAATRELMDQAFDATDYWQARTSDYVDWFDTAIAMVERCAREVREPVTRAAILADFDALRGEVEER